jgi:hypothetical protein
MKDQDPLDLAAYRNAKNREQRNAALARRKPSAPVMAWAALVAFAAVTYFAFGSNEFATTAKKTRTIEQDDHGRAQTPGDRPSTNTVDTPAPAPAPAPR